MAWLPVNIEQILNNRIPDVRQNIPAYVPQAVSNVSAVVPTNKEDKTSRRKGPGLAGYCKEREPAELAKREACRNTFDRVTGIPGVKKPNPADPCLYGGPCITGVEAYNYCLDNPDQYGCSFVLAYTPPEIEGGKWTPPSDDVDDVDDTENTDDNTETVPTGGNLPTNITIDGCPEGQVKYDINVSAPGMLNLADISLPCTPISTFCQSFPDLCNAEGTEIPGVTLNQEDKAKQEAADFGQQILDATSVDELSDLLTNNPDMLNNPHLASWVQANGQFPITDDVGIWANLDNIFAECVQGRPCDLDQLLGNIGIMFPSIINLPEWAKILGVGIFKLPSIWEMMQKAGNIFETVSGKIKCTRTDDEGNERDCTVTERISNSLCVLKPDADCCPPLDPFTNIPVGDPTCSPGDLISGAVGSVVGIGTDVLGQIIGKIETLEDKITGAGKYGDILTGNCKEPNGTPKECTWDDLPKEVLDDIMDIFGPDASQWPPWVWAIIGSSVLGGLVTKQNFNSAKEECENSEGTWDGTSCVLPDTPDDDNFCLDKYGEGVRANDNSPSKCEKPCNGGWIDADLVCEQSLGCPEGGCPDVDGVPYKCDPVLDKCVPDVEGTSCAEQNRQDIPGNDLECGGCLGNFVDIDGVCVEKQTCSDPNSQVNADGSCGECNSGYNRNETDLCVPDTVTGSCWDANRVTDSNGNCTEECKSGYAMGLDQFGEFSCIPTTNIVEDCSNPEYAAANPEECKNTDPDCAAQNRVTVSTGDRGIGAGETSCGKCINGYTEDGEGNCVPFKYTCSDPNATVLEDGRCGPCKEGYIFDTVDGSPTHDSCIPKGSGPGTPSDDDEDDLDLSGGGGGGGGQTNFTPFTGGPQWNPAKIGLAALPMSMMSSEGFLQGLLGGSTEGQPQQTAFNQSQRQQSGMLDARNQFANAYNQYAVAPASFFNFLNQGRG